MRRSPRRLAALLPLIAWGAICRADMITYDTTASWNGSDGVAGWGSVQSGFTPTFGQTFVAPDGSSQLLDFTFHVTNFAPGSAVTFQAAVYAWSGALTAGAPIQGALGPALFTSPDMVFVDDGDFQAITIVTGGVDVLPGAAYVALLTTSGPGAIEANADSLDFFEFGLASPSHLPSGGGGGFHFFNNAAISQIGDEPWDDDFDFGDLAWTANFSPIPEPGSLFLMAGGGLILVGYGLPRRPDPKRRAGAGASP